MMRRSLQGVFDALTQHPGPPHTRGEWETVGVTDLCLHRQVGGA